MEAPQVTDRPRRLLPTPSLLCTMILCLLFPGLILGVVESQTANVTLAELSEVWGNRTFNESTADNSTMTSSPFGDPMSHIEDELLNNQTYSVHFEDEESFQDQDYEPPPRRCQQELLVRFSHSICGEIFHMEMMPVGSDNWCVLEKVIRPYNNMTLCLEKLSNIVGCYYPNPDIQEFFLGIHAFYFHNCSSQALDDAPQGLVIVLTLVPVSLIPVLVYLVVWKVQD